MRFAIDPKHAANERITDVALAPRDHSGRVEFESDASILVPVDRRRASGRVMLDVVNRGNTVALPNFNRATRPTFVPGADPDPPVDPGDGFLMRRGFVVISCGWQIDLPEVPGLLGLRGPEALDANGNRITGRVYTQLQTPSPATHLLLSDRGHRAYQAADLASAPRFAGPHQPTRCDLIDRGRCASRARPARSSRMRATSGSRAASRRAACTRSPIPRSARR